MNFKYNRDNMNIRWKYVNNRNIGRSKIFLPILLLFNMVLLSSSCGHWGWEDVESDYESELSVIGFISLDETLPSQIIVERTLRLDEPTYELIPGTDTVWYGNGPNDFYLCCTHQRSLYGIGDAEVIVSDGISDYSFYPRTDIEEGDYISRGRFNWYYDTTGTFQPLPETTYYLTVTALDSMILTGEVTTPSQIHIVDDYEHTPDTLNAGVSFEVTWQNYDGPGSAIVSPLNPSYYCGVWMMGEFQEGSNSWVSPHEQCDGGGGEFWDPDTVQIEIIGMENNYYDYFIKHSGEDDFIDFIMGGGNTGASFGVEGGIGVFGAITVDRIYRVMKP